MLRASDLRLNGREFDPWPPHYRSVGTAMGHRLREGIPPRYVTGHPGQLSLLPSVGREISTGQSAVMRCGWGVKAGIGWLVLFVEKLGWKVKLCDPSLTRAIQSALEMSCHEKEQYRFLQLQLLQLQPGTDYSTWNTGGW